MSDDRPGLTPLSPLRIAVLFTLLFRISVAHAETDTLDYLYSPNLDERGQLLVDRILTHARNGEYEYAMELGERLLEQSGNLAVTDPEIYGQILVNQGIVHSASEDYEPGLAIIDRGLEYLELRSSPFSTGLVNAIMAKGLTERALDQFEAAEDTLRRAQHITHREGGVYSKSQLPIVNQLTATYLRQGHTRSADQQQLFSLRVAEQVHGPYSTELLPILTSLGSYFATRGSAFPLMVDSEVRILRDMLFDYSVDLFQRAIEIIENNYGRNDLRLVEPLRGLAGARLLQGTNRRYAEDALERSLSIVESSPDSDLTDRARAMVDLADLYITTGDARAAETYLQAWQLLQETEESRQLANSLFSTPVRIYPRSSRMMYLDRQPDNSEPGDPLFVSLEYAVTVEGKVSDVRVIDRNVPNEEVRQMRLSIRNARFRPRIIDAEIVPTDGLVLYQPFQVLTRSPRTEELAEDSDLQQIRGETPEDVTTGNSVSTFADDEVP